MKRYNIKGTKVINTSIKLPASKSISNRALILSAMMAGECNIHNLSDCDDTNVMVAAFQEPSSVIDVKAAGTSMRFLTAFLSNFPGEWVLTGTQRMQQRPIHVLVDALNALGARIRYLNNEGFPPLDIKGTALKGGEISLSGSISSQFISALLMIAPAMDKGLTVHLTGNIISVPYLKLTLSMMSQFGAEVHWTGNTIRVEPGEYIATDYLVESDWSAASYWYQMVALADEGRIELLGLFKNSMQGDSKVAELFLDLGVSTEFTDTGVILTKTNRIVKKFFHDFINEPDLAQTFVVTCCMLDIPFMFTGLQTLRIKETDRIEALKVELRKLGFVLTDNEDRMLEWDGEMCEREEEPTIATYEDHRMAMAFAPAAMKLNNLLMAEPGVVSKSYPNYWNDLKKAGYEILE